MKKKLYLALTTATVFLSGCGATAPKSSPTPYVSNQSELQEQQEVTLLEESPSPSIKTFENEAKKYSDAIEDCYASYKKTLNNNFPQYTLSDIEEDTVNSSKFYSFKINTPEGITQPEVTFQNEKISFEVSLPAKIENNVLKDIITCTIMSTDESIDINSANEIMQNLSNSFDGSNDSDVFSTDNHKFYISANTGAFLGYLHVISNLELNPPINEDDYIQATNELFNGELNKGTNAYIKGTILGDYDLGTNWCLEVSSDTDVYCVYYNFDKFIDCLEIGNTYTFYGQIAAMRKGYAGCLRLEHISSVE